MKPVSFGRSRGTRRRSKYGNRKTELMGIVFDSAKEARRYQELLLLAKVGAIKALTTQPKYRFYVAGVTVGSFRPDFYYVSTLGKEIVEDVKSPATRKETSYRLRRKLFAALYPTIEFREV